jgi:hypothetical protein
MKRKVLVILSNRLNRLQKPLYIEVDCDEKGSVLKEHRLRSKPRDARYHEVWENDEGKTDWASCHSFKRNYGHALEKPRARGAQR